jgi:hypothetical protein
MLKLTGAKEAGRQFVREALPIAAVFVFLTWGVAPRWYAVPLFAAFAGARYLVRATRSAAHGPEDRQERLGRSRLATLPGLLTVLAVVISGSLLRSGQLWEMLCAAVIGGLLSVFDVRRQAPPH